VDRLLKDKDDKQKRLLELEEKWNIRHQNIYTFAPNKYENPNTKQTRNELAERKRLVDEEIKKNPGLSRSKSSNLNVGHSFVKKNNLE